MGETTLPGLLLAIYGHGQVRSLLYLVGANLVLGVAASLMRGDFRLTLVADWLTKRVIPLVAGYGAAALLALSNPELSAVRDLAWATLSLALIGYVLSNLRELGIPIPAALSRPTPDTLASSQRPTPVVVVPPAAATDDARKE